MTADDLAPILVLDGGLGTSLEDDYNVKFDEHTPLWSSHLLVNDPDTLRACQKDFGSIPVDILLTATYQASEEAFLRTKTADHPNGISRSETSPYLDLAISIAEEVKASTAQIALSLGSYGASMIPSQEYSGRYDAEHNSTVQLLDWHRDRLRLFDQIERLKYRINYVAFETVPRIDEIKAIRKVFSVTRSSNWDSSSVFHGDVPFWISCVFPGDDYILPDGSDVDQVVDALLNPIHSENVPWGIGINCTKVAKIPKLIRMFENAVSRLASAGSLKEKPALVLYPDGTNGEVYDTITKTWQVPTSQETPKSPWERQLADAVLHARNQHCWRMILVGGCCKAYHRDIARLRAILS
ncbi:Homocysteine S-methyltransferase [Hypoxylon sp. FL1150]|nr:Homocysteine S-methyltransferase [Hypoxylon sp. FL1150]